jgi:hypothetical protein
MKKIIKKISLALVVCALLVSMTACGNEAGSDASEASEVSEQTSVALITAEEFRGKILEKVAFEGDMIDCTKLTDYPLDTHGIKGDTYTSHVYLEVSDTTNSYETVIVFSATSADNAKLIKEKLDSYISNLKAQFENYNATIIDMVNKSVVKADGNKAYLVISPNVREIEEVIKNNLKAFN